MSLVVVITLALRVFGAAAYYRGRPPRVDVLLILFSLETLVVVGLLALSFVNPGPYLGDLAQTIFSTWVAALFTVLPPYLIFVGLSEMMSNRGVVRVLIPLGFELGLLAFAATAALELTSSLTLTGFFDFLVALSRPAASASVLSLTQAVPILVPSVAVYCSLLVYSALPSPAGASAPGTTLLLPLVGATVALGWLYAAILLLPDSLLSLTVPGVVLVAALWVYMRR